MIGIVYGMFVMWKVILVFGFIDLLFDIFGGSVFWVVVMVVFFIFVYMVVFGMWGVFVIDFF